MLFNSFEFLFFFPVAVVIYYLLPHRYRWIWLLTASYYFYMSWKASLILLLLASTAIDYFCGLKMSREDNRIKRRRYLYLSLISNLGILFFFKYLGFFSNTTVEIFSFFGVELNQIETSGYNAANIILPVGISFYTFQTLSYSFDVYRGLVKPEKNFGRFALYVSFFPQLVAGPIERPDRLLPQFLQKIKLEPERIRKGLIIMAWGFFLKLVVADRIGVYVDEAFFNTSKITGIPLLFSSYLFAFQIYYDFAAYTTIAIGAAYVMGFSLMENFDRPFFGKSLADFWRRWHISLTSWFKDYLYKPLVQKFGISTALAVLLVFAFTGLWHGANWTFVIWGVLNGIFLIVEVLLKRWRKEANLKPLFYTMPLLNTLVTWVFCFHLIVFSLIFFRASSVDHAMLYFNNMFNIDKWQINIISDKIEILIMVSLILLVQIVNYFKGESKVYELVLNRTRPVRWIIYIGFLLVMTFFAISRKEAFIYHQF